MDFVGTLPIFTLSAASNVGTTASASVTLPMLMASGATQSISMPMLGVTATLMAGNTTVAQDDHDLPKYTVSASILGGRTYSGNARLPAITFEASFGTEGRIRLPQYTVASSAIGGNKLTAAARLPRLTASGAAYSDGIASASTTLPMFTISAGVTAGMAMSANITLRMIALAATGHSGKVASGSIELPMFALESGAYGEYIGQASIELPMLQLVSTVGDQTGVTESFITFAMTMDTAALTNYDNFEFNSMARFNGVDLMANENGLFAIGGSYDVDVVIDAYARVGVSDFGTMNHKLVDYAYIGYRADGEMRLKVIVDGHHEYEYQVYPRNYDDIHGNRLKMGKGLKGTYWQVEIGNVDGAGFDLDSLQLVAQPLARKV